VGRFELKKNQPAIKQRAKTNISFHHPSPQKQNSITKQNQTIKLGMTAICVIVWDDHKLMQ
jgi:hypothetical protein